MASNSVVRLRKGYDIKLIGAAENTISEVSSSDIVSVNPPDFQSVIPKMLVAVGDEVRAGEALFYDKNNPQVKFASPVSGEVAEIVRGAKRRIMEVRLLKDKSGVNYKEFGKASADSMSRDAVITRMLEGGVWPCIIQRPYGVIARPDTTPKAVFVSCFDSGPLAPNMDLIINSEKENFQAGLTALKQLSNGNLHLGTAPNQTVPSEGATVHTFEGPHPAGNVGVQIHHVDPIKNGEDLVWTVGAQDVLVIGRLFNEGRYRADRIVALVGSGVKEPKHLKVTAGQKLDSILGNLVKTDRKYRVIQGNVLTGARAGSDSNLNFYGNQITVIPEGDEPELFGWIAPGLKKLSLSRTYFSWLTPKKKYDLTTNLQGEKRHFVVSGQYEKVLPMNIMPVHLLKAILAKDVERMDALGIFEVTEEDLALCEFVCTSKIDVQKIVREGLDLMRSEMGG